MTDAPVAIVTAASKGLGAACARELGRRGYRLVLMARSEAVEDLAAEAGGLAVRGSVAEPADLEAVVKAALEAHGRVDAVLNNTGHIAGSSTAQGPLYNPDFSERHLLDLSDADWHAGLDMIVLNVVRMSRLITGVMEEQGGGAIVNMSSFAGKEPSAAFPLGAALRMALAGFTKLYADRYARAGIRMNSVLPGFIENWPMSDDLRKSVPMGRPGHLDEVSKTVAFLLSADAGYITGQSLLIDGGLNRGV